MSGGRLFIWAFVIGSTLSGMVHFVLEKNPLAAVLVVIFGVIIATAVWNPFKGAGG